MPIRFECSSCGKRIKAREGSEGKRTKCPGCGAIQTIPEMPHDAEPVELDRPDSFVVEETPKADTQAEQRRPCPACGEMIMVNAAKCRFCNKILDPRLKKMRKKKRRRSSSYDEDDMTFAEYFVAVACSGIGCIIGLIWMIQGNPKGPKMVLISICSGFFWGVVNALLTEPGVQP